MVRSYRPLRDVRILSFEVVASLPATSRMLADWGAEVVRVMRPEGRGGQLVSRLDNVEIGKASLSIDLRKANGQQLATRLAAVADIVCNNFTPRVMKGFGLDYDTLRVLRPDLIYLQLSGYGSPGPWENFPAFGPSIEAASGLNLLSGNTDDPPVKAGSDVLADFVSGRYAAFALQAALLRREITGEGQFIDLSMHESMVHLEGHFLAAASVGLKPTRRGNRDPVHAPQGVYPCLGEDEWVALSVTSDSRWQHLVEVLGDERLFGTAQSWNVERRRDEQDFIDQVIAGWTGPRTKDNVAALLQERGIAAGPVLKQSDLHFDRHLNERHFFQLVDHAKPIFGSRAHPYMQVMPSVVGFPRPALNEASTPPEDDRRILKRWLGANSHTVRELQEEGVLRPANPGEPSVAALGSRGSPVDPNFAERLRLPVGVTNQ